MLVSYVRQWKGDLNITNVIAIRIRKTILSKHFALTNST